MNSRERLQRITKEANDAGRVASCSDNDAAALRELDQLLSDMVKIQEQEGMTSPNDYWLAMNDWFHRAAQAGYGESGED